MAYDKGKIYDIKLEILGLITDGLSLSKALDSSSNLPCRKTVYNWFNKDHEDYDESFLHNYMRARDVRSDRIFEEILEIADESSGDEKIDSEGNRSFNNEFAARSRIRIDARKWALGKMQPKKYGDKLDITSDGDKIQQAVITIDPLNDKTDDSTE